MSTDCRARREQNSTLRMPILWVEGRNLMDNGAIWLPFEIVHADLRIPGAPMSGCFSMSTNGLASGNRLLEAVSHALCEIIERDATSIWHQSPHAEQDARRLDLATIDDANSLAILDLLAKAQLDVGVWDITTDLGVCAFYCMIVDRVDELGHIGVGAACHPAQEPRSCARSWKRRKCVRPTSSDRARTSSRSTMIRRPSADGTPRCAH